MSNLSTLLPVGSAGKTFTATASGAIATKKPVILNSAGTVTQAGMDTTTIATNDFIAGSQGTANIHKWARPSDCAWDSADTNKFLFCTERSNVLYGIVGTVSNSGNSTSVSLGTPISIVSTGVTNMQGMAADPNNAGKFVIVYGGASSTGMAVSVVFSGATGLTVGTPQQFDATIDTGEAYGFYGKIAADPNVENQYMIIWNEPSSVKYLKAIMMTLASGSGTTMTFGSAVNVHTPSTGTDQVHSPNLFASPKDSGIFVVTFRDPNNSGYGTARCLSVSGTTITSNTATAFMSYGESIGHTGCFNTDVSGQFLAITYGYGSGGYTARQWQGYVGTVNTSTKALTFGSMVGIGSTGQTGTAPARVACAGGGAGKFLINHLTTTGSIGNSDVMQTIGTISSGAVTFTTPNHTYTDEVNGSGGGIGVSNDPNNFGRFVSVWAEANDASTPQRAFVTEVAGSYDKTNLTTANFLGFADAAIANGASGDVLVRGGTASLFATESVTHTVTVASSKFVIDGVSQDTLTLNEGSTYKFDQSAGTNAGHPLRLSSTIDGTHGSLASVQYDAQNTTRSRAAYDPVNKKVVTIFNRHAGDWWGHVVVGTVKGTRITYGDMERFVATNPTWSTFTYAGSGKVVASYRDSNNSDYGTAVVGTISGTTSSWGTPVVFNSANSSHQSATYDSNADKVVLTYQDGGNSSHGTAIVGTVSGDSISFGSEAVFEAAGISYPAATFDDNSNKVVIAYKDEDNSGYGTAIVGTVSGTSISFGTAAVFQTNATNEEQIAFDTTANKVVIAYQSTSDYGTAVVGTVSGTSISFGSATTFNSANANNIGLAHNANTNKTTIAFRQAASTTYGTLIDGTISGTGISFGSPLVFEQSATTFCSVVYDPDQKVIVISYIGPANTGKSIAYPVTEYTSGVTTSGTPGSAGAYTQIVVASPTPDLNYYCSVHSGYGGIANTPGAPFAINSDYYVQADGTFGTSADSPSVKAGKAITTTSLILTGES